MNDTPVPESTTEETDLLPTSKKKGWLSWRTRDILLTAVIGLIFGILLSAASYFYVATIALGALGRFIWIAPYCIPSFFAAYVLRRGGAAILAGVIYTFVGIPFTALGVTFVGLGAMLGISVEISLAIVTRYKHFSLWRMVLTGLLTGLIILLAAGIPSQVYHLEIVVQGIIAAVSILGCALAAIVTKYLADAVARTGVFSGTALSYGVEEEV
jgi:energy-coupling factor transport system substrate-specific component